MSDLEFFSASGRAIPTTSDGLEALHRSEFDAWFVRWSGPDRGAPFVRLGEQVLQLVADDRGYVPPPQGRGRNARSRNATYAGVVTLFADQACTLPLRPWLRVETANMSAGEFSTILDDLRSLTFALSAYFAPTPSKALRVGPGEGELTLLRAWVMAARAAEKCLEAYSEQLPRIARNPARTMRREIRVVSAERAVRMGKGHLVERWPEHLGHVAIPTREYSIDTAERRFLNASLESLCREADALAALLRRRLQEVAQVSGELDEANAEFRRIGRLGVKRADVRTVEEAGSLADHLQELTSQVSPSGLEMARPEDVLIRTNKLMMSAEYRPVALAWEAYRGEVAVPLEHVQLLAGLDEQSIAPTWQLYERWVIVKLYTALVERGFRPPEGEPNLLDRLAIADGAVVISGDDAPLRLTRDCGLSRVDIVLRHEPPMTGSGQHPKTPDLVIDASAGDVRETWVFDAKYKDYGLRAPANQLEDEQRYGSHFYADLIGVAEVKYRQWIRPTIDVSGILHPDTRPMYTFWDPLLRGGDRHEACRAPTPHALLSVALRPGVAGESNVTKLMRLLLGYRLKLTSTCWRCGGAGARMRVPGSSGDGYSCEGCGSFWIVHRCFKEGCRHRPLLKFGRASFHHVEPPPHTYNVHCPRCGSYFRGALDNPRIPHPIYGEDEPF